MCCQYGGQEESRTSLNGNNPGLSILSVPRSKITDVKQSASIIRGQWDNRCAMEFSCETFLATLALLDFYLIKHQPGALTMVGMRFGENGVGDNSQTDL